MSYQACRYALSKQDADIVSLHRLTTVDIDKMIEFSSYEGCVPLDGIEKRNMLDAIATLQPGETELSMALNIRGPGNRLVSIVLMPRGRIIVGEKE